MTSPSESVVGIWSRDRNKHIFPPNIARVIWIMLDVNGSLFSDWNQSFICLQIGEGVCAILTADAVAIGEVNY